MVLEGWHFLLLLSSSKYGTVLFPGSRVAEEVKLGSNALIAVFMTRRAAILIGWKSIVYALATYVVVICLAKIAFSARPRLALE